MAKKPITAQELVDSLEADPTFRAECAADERDLVSRIRGDGYDIDSVWDLVNNVPHEILERRFIGPYPRAYSTLVAHLGLPHHPRVREGIIRSLIVKDGGPPVEEALWQQFQIESDVEVKWVLANALRSAMPYHRRRKHPEIRDALNRGKIDQ